MTEEWRDINGYEGIYQVSSLGRVRSLDRIIEQVTRWGDIHPRLIKGTCLQPHNLRGGYLGVMLSEHRQKKMTLIHRLVAIAFIPNPQSLETVNHKDENKKNNRADNLEWMSRGDNVRYGTGIQRKRNTSIPVVQMSIDGTHIQTYTSAKAAGETLGLHPTNITACCRGKRGARTAGGYRWKYLNNGNEHESNETL